MKIKRLSGLILFILLISACGQYDPDSTGGEGSIAFSVEWQKDPAASNSKPETSMPVIANSPVIASEAKQSQGSPLMTVSNCSDVSTVEAAVYDSNNITLATGGPWACSAHSGSITGVPAGSNRKVVILGKDSSGNIRYRGEQTAIAVTAGQTANAGTIIASSFTPTDVSATAGNTQVTLSWTAVTGAKSYNIYMASIPGVTKNNYTSLPDNMKHTGVTSPFIHTGLINGKIYYFIVTAVDAKGESAESTEVLATPSAGGTTFTLTVTKSGTGTGTVTSAPTGINCGTTCSGSFTSSTAVTLTATPDAGSTFAGWSGGGCTGTGTCVVTISAATSVTATFNTTAGIWATKAPMPTARWVLAVGEGNGTLYAVGGFDSNNARLATVEAYDPMINSWTTKASMPTVRSGLAVGEVNGILYAVGGGTNSGIIGTVEAYDPTTNLWTTKASMPTARRDLAIGVVSGILYAVGGFDNNGVRHTTVEAYDPTTNSWTAKASMPTGRCCLAIGVVNSILYTVGGITNTSYATTVEAYDPVTNAWTTKASMPTGRGYLAVGVVSGDLYAIGGVNGTTILATVEAYTP